MGYPMNPDLSLARRDFSGIPIEKILELLGLATETQVFVDELGMTRWQNDL
ncbi:MAG: hypothetical protein ACLVAT_02770 [Lachnospiraceae bacterium]